MKKTQPKEKKTKPRSWKKLLFIGGGAVLILAIAAQFLYPFDHTMQYAEVDTVQIGGMSREEAVAKIVEQYKASKVAVYFGGAKEPYRSPTLAALGADINADRAVEQFMYPVWLRLIPTSYWWGHIIGGGNSSEVSLSKSDVQSYAEKEFGASCDISPKDAAIVVKESGLVLSPSANGGTCKLADVTEKIMAIKPTLVNHSQVRISLETVAPEVTDAEAKVLLDRVNSRLKNDIKVVFKGKGETITAATVRSWLNFPKKKGKLVLALKTDTVKKAIQERFALKVTKAAGTVTVTLRDGKEISRSGNDAEGCSLNVEATVHEIEQYLSGTQTSIQLATTTLKPKIVYKRTYSGTSAGFSALIRDYAESHPGVYGVSFVELSGKGRQASYNQTRNFFPASTYKLFIAYSTLRRVEVGKMKWSDTVKGTGRTLEKCFDDMIVLSDNACPEKLRDIITMKELNKDLAGIGLYGTRFIGAGEHRSTAADLSSFLSRLESGGLPLSGTSRSKLLGAMKRNVYRQGIPAGASGAVADKVGFIWGLLHDAAIVYSPKGTYVLVIMTDGSSWGSIAELTREIEKLRTR